MLKPSVVPVHFATPAIIKHDIYLYDDIGTAENYVELVQALNEATENDVINIKIATGGGDLDGCIAIIHAIRNSKAMVIGHADAIVASAGTIIFLACHNWVIGEFAYFMFHDGGGVMAGKFNETAKQIAAIQKLYKQIADKVYKPFFTEEEIQKIMDGADLYQTAEEMADRINAAFPELAEDEDGLVLATDEESEVELLRG
jgi:ATP-dependent protease ClpP protease subunit